MLKLSPLAALSLLIPAAVSADVHRVVVGGQAGLVYTPEFVNAPVGDTIIFEFHQKNHTATQSTFAAPCAAIPGGTNSGFMPVGADVTSNFPTFNVTVSDMNPVWFHCEQTGHCPQGMVFAINPPSSGNTFDKFKAAAVALGNATSTTSSGATTVTETIFTVPPSPSIVTVTQTITLANNTVYTTTYGEWPGASPNPTPAPTPVIHPVDVGLNGLNFTPPTVEAQPGDIIQFTFHAKNHSVSQSASFLNPCDTSGIDSGFMPVAANASSLPTFNITINETTPLWIHCAQTVPVSHCQAGMVFAVNAPPTGDYTFPEFLAIATHSNSSSSGGSSNGTSSSGGNGGGKGNGANGVVASTILATLVAVSAGLLAA